MIKVYIDMDGVLADFDGACTEPLDKNGDHPEMFREGFFRNLEVMDGAEWAIEELLRMKHLDVMVATKPTTKTDYCASEKIAWLREHFPELVRKINIVTNKLNLKGHYLIDDDLRWKDFDGYFIHFDKESSHAQWMAIVQFFMNQCV